MTKDEIIERAKKFNSYSEFRKQDPKAYGFIKKLQIFDEVKALFPEVVPYSKLTDAEIIELARGYKTKEEIHKEAPSVHREAYVRGITAEAFAHCEKEKLKVESTDEEILAVARRYKNLHDFMLQDKGYYNLVRTRGLLPKVKEMLQTRVIYSKLPNDELIQIARQYSTRKELQTQCSGVDKLIYARGIADEALSHIPLQRTDTYTKEFIFSEMKKYQSQKELQIKDSKVYNAAKKRKILKGFYEKIQNVHAGVSVGEVSLCLFFDRIFNSKFEKTRDIIKFGKSSLELDGYSKDLGIAFEHQGDQHYLDAYRGKSTAKIKEKDYFKVEFCKNNGIKLIIIRDIINFYKNDHKIVKDELKKEFNRLNIEIPELFYSTDIEIISPRDNRWTYEKLLTAAKKYQDYTSLLKEERGARDFVYKLKLTERLCAEMNWTSPKKVIKIQK